MDGCVKFAYPHGHDELLLIALENKTRKQTLLRTVPDVAFDGTFLEFQPHQVYKDAQGFPVTKDDDYEMVMVHHHPLQKQEVQHGMGNYLLYMTPGTCSNTASHGEESFTAFKPGVSLNRSSLCFRPSNFVQHFGLQRDQSPTKVGAISSRARLGFLLPPMLST